MTTLPLFPLHTVVFPGTELQLRVFEMRYLDLVRDCLRNDTGFGICRIVDGNEVGAPATCAEVGTSVAIADWDQHADGILGITVRGLRRFRVESLEVDRQQLLIGQVRWLDDHDAPVDADDQEFLKILMQQLVTRHDLAEQFDLKRVDDPRWLGYRLAELLPMDGPTRQCILELDGAGERLHLLRSLIERAHPPQDRPA
jgi:hypothetical protein